jgi:hypothetical protein
MLIIDELKLTSPVSYERSIATIKDIMYQFRDYSNLKYDYVEMHLERELSKVTCVSPERVEHVQSFPLLKKK